MSKPNFIVQPKNKGKSSIKSSFLSTSQHCNSAKFFSFGPFFFSECSEECSLFPLQSHFIFSKFVYLFLNFHVFYYFSFDKEIRKTIQGYQLWTTGKQNGEQFFQPGCFNYWRGMLTCCCGYFLASRK